MSGDMLLIYLSLLYPNRLYGYTTTGVCWLPINSWAKIKMNDIEFWLRRLGVIDG